MAARDIVAYADVVLRSGAGIDVDVVEDDGRQVLRVSAIPGDGDYATTTSHRMAIIGDECVSVTSIPHVSIDAAGVMHEDAESGVVVLGSTCKPCCQCEDYYAAALALKGLDDRLAKIRKTFSSRSKKYTSLADAYDRRVKEELDKINVPGNVDITYAKMVGPTGSRNATGFFTVTICVANSTMCDVTVTMSVANGSQLEYHSWAATNATWYHNGGATPHNIPIGPGGSLTYTAVLSRAADVTAPSATYTVTAKLSNGETKTETINV